ncbi:hypothetical protein AB0H57_05490 [Micromonospora sp. NPDC050686]|uniref:hypothetical protein n=1 Tax=Micromonospora sp. NPDC050686 TaxID=3154631 RepID=UPI0033DF2A9B
MTEQRKRRTPRLAAVPQNPPATVDDPVHGDTPSKRCKANARTTGDQCANPPMMGQEVCRMHGGSAPQARKAAALRLLELADPAITALSEVVKDAPKDSDRVRAATAILDRAGLGPSSKIEVETPKWKDVFHTVIVDEDGNAAPHELNRYAQPDEDDDYE